MSEIRFEESICRDLPSASAREWLETNGIGGYASSTIAGMNTRRYHGLLVAATKPPVGRMVLLSKMEETLIVDGVSYELSTNRYPGVIHPEGYLRLSGFRLDPFPTFTYQVADVELEKSLFMVEGEDTTVIGYRLRGGNRNGRLELRPLIAFRDYHATTHENGALNPSLDIEENSVGITPYSGLPSLYLAHTAAELRPAGDWYRHFEYQRERERGLDFEEDLYNPCALVLDLGLHPEQAVIASTIRRSVANAGALRLSEITRRQTLLATANTQDPFVQSLTRAAHQFIARRGDFSTVMAGYHWFTDWGRDTMIALPGLTLSTGNPEIARKVLLAFAASVNQGMLPNRFPDAGEAPEYNNVDATLWFFEAARAYLAHTGDLELIRARLYPVFDDIIGWHERGTRYGIKVAADGLLHAGQPGMQLTWMDARVGDHVVTPRQGKPVEIQALWYNALRVMEDLAARLSLPSQMRYRTLAERARTSFTARFWNAAQSCLYDVVDGDNGETTDASIRPNQIFAASLFHTMLSPARAAAVVETVRSHLLTPYGLRTLSPADPQYRGRYEGDPASRDGAYHQGAVWPWLMGPFLKAYVAVGGGSGEARKQAKEWLADLTIYLHDQGVGQMPEVFDGDAPHRPGGCIAQAWSVGELLHACVEEVNSRPGSYRPDR